MHAIETDTRPIRTSQDAAGIAAGSLRRTLAAHGASMTIQTGERSATIGPDGVSGHVTDTPHGRPFVPPEAAFDDDDFQRAPELERIVAALIAKWPELAFLEDVSIACRWKKAGGKSSGKPVLARNQKPSGLLKHFANCEYIIWVAADHLREMGLSNYQLEACLYHELQHCGFEIIDDEKSPRYGETRYVIRAHDDEVFFDDLRRYGAWNHQHEGLETAFQQLALAG